MLELAPLEIVLALAIVVVGSVLQGSIGFGMGLLSAPVLGLLDPDFLPVAVIVSVIPLGVGVVLHDHRHIEWRQMATALAGRTPGVVIGAWLVRVVGSTAISMAIALSVLLAVVGSLTRRRFRPTPLNLVTAGLASGITGTAAGIGGPPIALTYQHSDPETLRATLGGFFTVGAVMSFLALAIGGTVEARQLQLSLLLVPATLTGLALSRLVVRRLAADKVRPVVLVACTASAIGLLIETFT